MPSEMQPLGDADLRPAALLPFLPLGFRPVALRPAFSGSLPFPSFSINRICPPRLARMAGVGHTQTFPCKKLFVYVRVSRWLNFVLNRAKGVPNMSAQFEPVSLQ